MIRKIIVRILKIFKSLLNLFFNLIIKFIKTFSFIIILKKYYSYFKFIAIYLKNFKYYFIYIWFIRSIAIFNILLGGFTIFSLTDFQNDYIILLEQYLTNFRKAIKNIFKYLIDLFSNENIESINKNNISDEKVEKIENKIPKDFPFYFLCFIALTTFSLAIYSNSDTIIAFISKLFFGRGGDDPDILVAKATTQFQIPDIIVTEPSSPSSPINTSFPEYNNTGTQSPKLNDSPISFIPSKSKETEEILQGMDDRMIKILENQYKNVGTQASKLNNDSITILSPNTFIYTKDTGDKGDKLLDGIREILEQII